MMSVCLPLFKWNLPDGIILRKMHYAPPQLVKMFKVFAHGHKDELLSFVLMSKESYSMGKNLL